MEQLDLENEGDMYDVLPTDKEWKTNDNKAGGKGDKFPDINSGEKTDRYEETDLTEMKKKSGWIITH